MAECFLGKYDPGAATLGRSEVRSEVKDWGWKDGSVVISIGCSSRGPGLDGQHSPGLCSHQSQRGNIGIYTSKTPEAINK